MSEKIVRNVQKMWVKDVLKIENENAEMEKWMNEKIVKNVQKISEIFVLKVENENVEMVR